MTLLKTIVTVVGARPQFIKVAPLSLALRESGRAQEILVHTGQHFDASMSDVFFEELEMARPDHHLEISGGGHAAMTGAMMQKLEPLLQDLRPDTVLVYGDTNSTLAGALTAAKLHLPVAHVEAGLRSFNRAMPEEINRIMADHLSDILFAPTDTATENLVREGIDSASIHQVGDVMFDAALLFGERARARSGLLSLLGVQFRRYALATLHRAENTDDPERLRALVAALETVADRMPVILPLHPRTRKALQRLNLDFAKVRTLDPLGYLDMLLLESQAAVIATDSGGIQKEAFFFKVPCVTLRNETEWRELVDSGWNRICPPYGGQVAEMILDAVGCMGVDVKPYGDGRAANAIASILLR
jgi:UDP-GlcNAc3NAcA epimerase